MRHYSVRPELVEGLLSCFDRLSTNGVTDTLSPPTLVADLVTNPKITPWLAAGLKKGCDVQYGIEMVHGQFGLMGRHLGLDIPDLREFANGDLE